MVGVSANEERGRLTHIPTPAAGGRSVGGGSIIRNKPSTPPQRLRAAETAIYAALVVHADGMVGLELYRGPEEASYLKLTYAMGLRASISSYLRYRRVRPV